MTSSRPPAACSRCCARRPEAPQRPSAPHPAASARRSEAPDGDDFRGFCVEQCARAARLRPLLTHSLPTYAVPALLELARAYLALDDVAGASAVLGQARDVLRQRPDLGILPGQVEELWSKLDIMPRAALPGASSLSTAELRLLPLLSTHLSFREIGERLYVSHNTVKTPAISVYRKLEVSSRSQAIEHDQQLGLLPAS